MKEWMPWQDMMMEECMREAGLGDETLKPSCASCGKEPSLTCSLYRCQTCGEFLECGECCVLRHQRTPCHAIEV